jgi:hypothetical protein
MNKLPVGRTIFGAYRFALGHLGTIIGLIWLPLVLATLLNFLPELSGTAGDASTNPVAATTQIFEGLAILALTQLLNAIIYVAVTRQALGLRQGSAIVHFALGPPEFRMFGATLLFLLVSVGCVLTFFMLLVIIGGLAAMQNGNVFVALPSVVVALGGCFALLYVLVRLGYLLAPVTIVENRVDLGRGWMLARGNFWRIFAVVLAIVAPIGILETGAMIALMGKELIAAMPAVGSSDAVVQHHVALIEDVIRRHMPQILFVSLILAPFNLGLSISASAFGYRALAPEGQRSARN